MKYFKTWFWIEYREWMFDHHTLMQHVDWFFLEYWWKNGIIIWWLNVWRMNVCMRKSWWWMKVNFISKWQWGGGDFLLSILKFLNAYLQQSTPLKTKKIFSFWDHQQVIFVSVKSWIESYQSVPLSFSNKSITNIWKGVDTH